MMRKVISKKFKGFNHDILFEFIVNDTHVPQGELAYLKTRNAKLDRTQICFAYIMLNGERKRISFSPLWPVLPLYSGVVKKLSGDDPSFAEWRKVAFDIIGSRISEFSNLLLQGVTDKKNFEDLEEIREVFLPWSINQIRKTGDVEEGAEITLQTEQGQELLQSSIADGRSLTPSLKKKIKQSVDHKNTLLKQHIREKGGHTNGDKSTH